MRKRIYVMEYKFLNDKDPRPREIICTDEKGFVEWYDEFVNDTGVCVTDMWYVESNKYRLTLTDVHAMKRMVYGPVERFTESYSQFIKKWFQAE